MEEHIPTNKQTIEKNNHIFPPQTKTRTTPNNEPQPLLNKHTIDKNKQPHTISPKTTTTKHWTNPKQRQKTKD